MSNKLPQKLDLGMASKGGRPHFYARNVMRNGDYATVGYIVGDIQHDAEIMIVAYTDFNTPAYIEQFKAYLLAINPKLVFANDTAKGTFIDVDQLIENVSKRYSLMSFEVEQIRNNPDKLHELYLVAKPKKLYSLPSQYNYESANSQYPLIQVFDGLTTMIHG